MVIGADGAASAVRSLGGIALKRRGLSKITGYLVDAPALPAPGLGHFFITKPAPVLASQTVRRLLASGLHETCSRQDAFSQLLCDCLIDYWERDARGREASMALLAMTDTRAVAILREIASILLLGMRRAAQQPHPLRD